HSAIGPNECMRLRRTGGGTNNFASLVDCQRDAPRVARQKSQILHSGFSSPKKRTLSGTVTGHTHDLTRVVDGVSLAKIIPCQTSQKLCPPGRGPHCCTNAVGTARITYNFAAVIQAKCCACAVARERPKILHPQTRVPKKCVDVSCRVGDAGDITVAVDCLG